MKKIILISVLLLLSTVVLLPAMAEKMDAADYHRAVWHPVHFSPDIDSASNEQCLSCHQEIIERKVLPNTLAGVATDSLQSWYQTLTSYSGAQETFHRRHLVTPLAKDLMNMKCTTCHQGWDPRESAPIPPDVNNTRFTLRKQVNPEICLMCHGKSAYQIMGLPSPWQESRDMFQDNCLLCHAGIRTTRHQVNFLNAEAIEKAGKENADTCFGCHGGRSWYRITYPYPRHAWDGMAKEIPEWAKHRSTQSEPRFRLNQQQAQQAQK
jgi:hypothetical protein